MSTVTTEFRAPATARARALRAAEGVIAGYIHTLAHAAARPAADREDEPKLGRTAARAYACGASRSGGIATRRRPALRRIPSPA